MSPPKLPIKPPIGQPITTDIIKQIVEMTVRELDPCHMQSDNTPLPKEARDCLRDAVLAHVTAALKNEPNVVVEKKPRCCNNGKEGLWIGLPAAVLDQLTRDMQKCLPRTGGGPPPNLGFTLMP